MKKKGTIKLYFLGLFFLCLLTWEYTSNIINFSNTVRLILYVVTSICFVLNIFSSKYTKREIFIMAILLAISLYTFYKMHEINIFFNYLAIISAKHISNKKIITFLLFFNLSLILAHIILTNLGISKVTKVYQTFLGGMYRQSYNMRHPNYFAAVLFWTLAAYLYLIPNKSRILKILLVLVIMIVSYTITYSRTAMILYILIAILISIKNKIIQQYIMNISKYIMIFVIILSIVLSYTYFSLSGNLREIALNLNEILSGRLYLSALGVGIYNLTMFGENIYLLTNEVIVIDSFYTNCLIQYGIIHMLILIFLFIQYPKYTQDYNEYILLLLVLITALTEKYVINITMVFPLFFLKNLLYKDRDNINLTNK